MAEKAGLVDSVCTPQPGYVEAMVDWNDPLYRNLVRQLPEGTRIGDFVTRRDVSARKPGKGPPG